MGACVLWWASASGWMWSFTTHASILAWMKKAPLLLFTSITSILLWAVAQKGVISFNAHTSILTWVWGTPESLFTVTTSVLQQAIATIACNYINACPAILTWITRTLITIFKQNVIKIHITHTVDIYAVLQHGMVAWDDWYCLWHWECIFTIWIWVI